MRHDGRISRIALKISLIDNSLVSHRTDTFDSRTIDSSFRIMPGYKWVRYTGARYCVPGMVTIGRDLDGANLVVGRAHHHGDLLPAKAKPEHGVAYVAWGGGEHTKHDFEILMPAEFTWIPSRHGQTPAGAVDAGRTSGGETLFVGRVIHNRVPTVGKIQPSHGCLYIPYNGEEVSYREYEVLVQY